MSTGSRTPTASEGGAGTALRRTPPHRTRGWTALALALVALLLGARTPAASAHAFLVETAPAQGARLERAPAAILLSFSEPAARDGAHATLRRHLADAVETGPLQWAEGARALRLPISGLAEGIYVVSWSAVSAIDGHGSSGEFAFAVGDPAAALPGARQASDTSWSATGASWAFLVGLALAAGGALIRFAPGAPGRLASAVARGGLVLALSGVGLALLVRSPPGAAPIALLAAAVLLALALAFSARARHPAIALALTLSAGAAWSTQSHAAGARGAIGAALDFLHLAAGALWAGALVVVVAALWRSPRQPAGPQLVRSYSRVAIYLVGFLAATGLTSAILLVPTFSDLWSTGYGRLILAKSALFAGALCLAAAGRRRVRPWRPRVLRSVAGAEALLVASVLALAGVLANVAPPAPFDATSGNDILGTPQIRGPAARDAGLAGQLTAYVTAGDGRLDVHVLVPGGDETADVDVTVEATLPDGRAAELHPRPCGTGCVSQRFALPPGRTKVSVTATTPNRIGGKFHADLRWPPAPFEPARLRRVIRTMRTVPRVRIVETVRSGPGARVRYAVDLSGRELIAAEPYAGGNVRAVWTVPGHPASVRYYLPGSQILGTLHLDARGRLKSATMVNPGHEITRTFRYPPAQ